MLKRIPIILLSLFALILIAVSLIFFGTNAFPKKVGIWTGSEKEVPLYVPVDAQLSDGVIRMQRNGIFSPIIFNADTHGSAVLKLSIFGITLKECDIAAIDKKQYVPSGQIVGMSVDGGDLFAGTVTLYDKETNDFCALAHGLDNKESNDTVKDGKIFFAETGSVEKGINGTMGSLTGKIYVDRLNGIFTRDTKYGIFGKVLDNFAKSGHTLTDISLSDEVTTGNVHIVSNVEGTGVKNYDAEIVGFASDAFVLHITDQNLLSKTGGVIHGMSGTPVIQNNKIVGAVSAGEEDNPETIYCIYIQDMLADMY